MINNQAYEEKFLELAGFAERKGNHLVGCCNLCREGGSWGKKKRLYYYLDKQFITCFNCGFTGSPSWYLKTCDEELDYDSNHSYEIYDSLSAIDYKEQKSSKPLPDNSINLEDKSQLDYYKDSYYIKLAKETLNERRLLTAINRPKNYYISIDDFIHKNRLTIPFYDEQENIVFYQTRSLNKKDNIKYLSKLNSEKTIYNVDKLDYNFPYIFIFEGPIDASFVKNGVALTGLNPTSSQKAKLDELCVFFKPIWVLDNQLDNKDVRNSILKIRKQGHKVFKWPNKLSKYKDINEICIERGVDEFPWKILKSNLY